MKYKNPSLLKPKDVKHYLVQSGEIDEMLSALNPEDALRQCMKLFPQKKIGHLFRWKLADGAMNTYGTWKYQSLPEVSDKNERITVLLRTVEAALVAITNLHYEAILANGQSKHATPAFAVEQTNNKGVSDES